MKKNQLKQLIREELNKAKGSFRFSEYESELPKETKNYVFSAIKSKYPNLDESIILKFIEGSEDYYYTEARRENKRGRNYPAVKIKDFIEEIIFALEEEGYV
jgi:hypothetical protein